MSQARDKALYREVVMQQTELEMQMLVLGRRIGEKIIIGKNIEVQVLKFFKGTVTLGITAPKEIPVHREEVKARIDAEEAAKEV